MKVDKPYSDDNKLVKFECLGQLSCGRGRPKHGVPTPMYFEGVLTDGGGANEFISATSRGRSRN